MAEVRAREHLCSLRAFKSFHSPSSRVLSAHRISSATVLRNPVHHVTSPCRPPLTCFLGSRSKYQGPSTISSTAWSFGTWSVRSRGPKYCGERGGRRLNQSFRLLPGAGAIVGRSSAGCSCRSAWEGEISFKSRFDGATESKASRWTQSSHIGAIQPRVPPNFVQHDVGLACLVLLGAYIWVRLFDFFTSKHILGQQLSRKIVHVTSGLLYMLCWPFFSTSTYAPYIAGLVPLANGIRLITYGVGLLKDEGLVKSMSRSGESRELLRGPLFYVMVLYFSTIFFWRQSPVGMISLSMMCGGDGIADIMGRKYGSKKLPYNSDKSFAGSIAMFLFGFLVSSLCVYYFSLFGFFELDLSRAAVRLALISLTATFVESLPITTRLDDNFTVPVTTFLMGIFLFPSSS